MNAKKGDLPPGGSGDAHDAPRESGSRHVAEARRVASIGHDLNNLLSVISASAQLVRAHGAVDDDSRASLDDIIEAGMLAAKLTRQLVSFGAGAVICDATADLNEAVMAFAGVLRGVVRSGVRTTVDLWHEPLPVHMQVTDIERILLNLAENAQDAMATGGSLRVETRPFAATGANPCALLLVADTGRGMDQETLARIYEPFFTTKPGKGTGLGLATVHNLVSRAGGHIHVDTAVGVGTTFRVLLPMPAAPPSEPPARPPGA
jgi:two-component system cell cycle sensor histidine kinase/response regulator CckA